MSWKLPWINPKSMYKLSYVVRVSAESVDELKRRCDEVFDFYDDTNVN